MRTEKQRPEVELNYMKRVGTNDHYFEVWVRSAARPDVKNGTIVDRGIRERRDIMIAAGALTEQLMENYGDGGQDPDRCAETAGRAYDQMLMTNPIPRAGDERPI